MNKPPNKISIENLISSTDGITLPKLFLEQFSLPDSSSLELLAAYRKLFYNDFIDFWMSGYKGI